MESKKLQKMGKSKRNNKITTSFKPSQDLGNQISEGRVAKQKHKKFENIKLRQEESEYIDPKTTQRILNAAQKQRAELARDFGPTPSEAKSRGLFDSKRNKFSNNSDEDESDSEKFEDGDQEDYAEHDFFDDLKINDEDEKALQMFQNR